MLKNEDLKLLKKYNKNHEQFINIVCKCIDEKDYQTLEQLVNEYTRIIYILLKEHNINEDHIFEDLKKHITVNKIKNILDKANKKIDIKHNSIINQIKKDKNKSIRIDTKKQKGQADGLNKAMLIIQQIKNKEVF